MKEVLQGLQVFVLLWAFCVYIPDVESMQYQFTELISEKIECFSRKGNWESLIHIQYIIYMIYNERHFHHSDASDNVVNPELGMYNSLEVRIIGL